LRRLWEWGQVREYWDEGDTEDEGDIEALEMLTLDASSAVENAWRALTATIEAHTAPEEAEAGADEDDDG
jgi:hypothetical protein